MKYSPADTPMLWDSIMHWSGYFCTLIVNTGVNQQQQSTLALLTVCLCFSWNKNTEKNPQENEEIFNWGPLKKKLSDAYFGIKKEILISFTTCITLRVR